MSRRCPHVTGAAIALCLLAGKAVAQPSASQPSRAPTWTVEIHGSLDVASNPARGTPTRTPAGDSFGAPGVFTSQRVSSWLFHDGAQLFNTVTMRVAPRPPAIVPLDPVLARAGTRRNGGAGFGLRLARRLTERAGAEFSIDFSGGGRALTPETLADIDVSRLSYGASFATLFGSSLIDAVAVATISATSGRHLVAAGAITYDLGNSGRIVPYLTIGAGLDQPPGETPTVTIDAAYEFRTTLIPNVTRETERVTLRFTQDRAAVLLFGGGFRWSLSTASALRADVRVHAGRNTSRVLVDTQSTTILVEGSEIGRLVGSTPGILFSTRSDFPTTLSGPVLEGFPVFRGEGTRVALAISLGYLRRF